MSATGKLIVVNAAVWVAVWIAGLWCEPEPWLSLPADAVVWLTRPWTLLSYMVVQYSFWHLLMNVLWLLMFGKVLELTMPSKAIWQLYLCGGLIGGFAYMAMGAFTGGAGMLCGASAGVLAIMVVAGLRSPDMELHMLLIGAVRLKWVVLAGIVLLMAGAGAGFGSIAAHAGGMLGGLLYTMLKKRHAVTHPTRVSRNGVRRVRHAIRRHRDDTQRLNTLLEKISASSYDSLTASEKRELHSLSTRLRSQSTSQTPADK